MNDDYSMSSGYDVLSSWGFVGSMLLMSIPIIGLILTIVWASGGTANLNRRNFARGYLILAGIAILLYIALILILVANGSSLDQIYNRFY